MRFCIDAGCNIGFDDGLTDAALAQARRNRSTRSITVGRASTTKWRDDRATTD